MSLLAIAELANRLDLHRNSVYALVKNSQVPYIRGADLGICFRREEIEAWLTLHSLKTHFLFEPILEDKLFRNAYEISSGEQR
jgi:excisionase family DNA binding protein